MGSSFLSGELQRRGTTVHLRLYPCAWGPAHPKLTREGSAGWAPMHTATTCVLWDTDKTCLTMPSLQPVACQSLRNITWLSPWWWGSEYHLVNHSFIHQQRKVSMTCCVLSAALDSRDKEFWKWKMHQNIWTSGDTYPSSFPFSSPKSMCLLKDTEGKRFTDAGMPLSIKSCA